MMKAVDHPYHKHDWEGKRFAPQRTEATEAESVVREPYCNGSFGHIESTYIYRQ